MSWKLLVSIFVLVAGARESLAAMVLTGIGNSSTQNFNSLSTTATDISSLDSSGWRFAIGTNPTFASGGVSATQASSSGSAFTTGGTYNLGGIFADRALGAMTSGAFASPNHLIVEITNQTGTSVTQLNYSFDWERYRINSAAASGTFLSSSDGSVWTAIAVGDTGSYSTGASAYGMNNASLDSSGKTGSITGLSINAGQSHFLRWTFNTTGANSQAIGLDNLSITAVPEPTSIVLVCFTGCTGLAFAYRRRKFRSRPSLPIRGIGC